jgi:predicted RNA-binding Zn-ribbon protein involved in translation (DUF1610 family)
MPYEIEMDDNGDKLCPDCQSASLVSKSDRRGTVNYFCTNCGWARLGGVDYPSDKKDKERS